jgi:Spy/CpxP family protein refolding chaperone
MHRITRLAACALACGGLFGTVATAAEEPAGNEATAAEESAQPAGDAADQPAAESPKAPNKSWWHEPDMIETLSITREQRDEMDGHLEKYRAQVQGRERHTPESFFDALRAGDWNDARRELSRLADQAGAPLRASGELKIDVLSTLTNSQRETVLERYPRLIQQPWVRTRPRGRGNPARRN